MGKRIRIFIISGLMFLFSAGVILAAPNAGSWQKMSDKVKEKRQTRLERRCEKTEAKIQAQVKRYENGKTRRLEAYTNLEDRLAKFIERFKTNGYDTSKLEADVKALSTKIDQFSTSYQEYITRLNGTKSYACGQSDGDFKNELKNARDLLTTLQEESLAIKTFYQETIKPDLLALKAQRINTSSTSTDSSITESAED